MMKFDGTSYLGNRVIIYAGDGQCEDDPRGRELTVNFEFGIPVGEFDAPKFLYGRSTAYGGSVVKFAHWPNPDYREYGSWSFGVHLWRWTFRISVRGPVLGHYPSDEDDLMTFDEAARLKE